MEKGVLSWSQLLDVGSKETRTELGTGLCSLLSLCTKLLYNVFFVEQYHVLVYVVQFYILLK